MGYPVGLLPPIQTTLIFSLLNFLSKKRAHVHTTERKKKAIRSEKGVSPLSLAFTPYVLSLLFYPDSYLCSLPAWS